jgi:hypothetical protein
LLTPGEYLVTGSHVGYKPQTRRVKVTNPKKSEATRLDFWLEPENGKILNKKGSSPPGALPLKDFVSY